MSGNALAEANATTALAPSNTPNSLAAIDEIKNRMQLLAHLLKEVLVEGCDFGVIPGTGRPIPKEYVDAKKRNDDKAMQEALGGPGFIVQGDKVFRAVLFQAGAQAVCTMFRLAPELTTTYVDLPGGHREVRATCRLIHIESGKCWGQTVGFCSTMESKYRYRGTQVEGTGVDSPRSYTDAKRNGDWKKASQILAETMGERDEGQFCVKQLDGQWQICRKLNAKQENENPADQFQTCEQMACKRALVSAARQIGASRLFAMDLIDEDDDSDPASPAGRAANAKPVDNKPATPEPPKTKPSDAKPAPKAPTKEQTPGKVVETIRAIPGCETVTLDDLEEYAQRTCKLDSCAVWNEDAYAAFRNIVAELRSKSAAPADFFPRLKGESN